MTWLEPIDQREARRFALAVREHANSTREDVSDQLALSSPGTPVMWWSRISVMRAKWFVTKPYRRRRGAEAGDPHGPGRPS